MNKHFLNINFNVWCKYYFPELKQNKDDMASY